MSTRNNHVKPLSLIGRSPKGAPIVKPKRGGPVKRLRTKLPPLGAGSQESSQQVSKHDGNEEFEYDDDDMLHGPVDQFVDTEDYERTSNEHVLYDIQSPPEDEWM